MRRYKFFSPSSLMLSLSLPLCYSSYPSYTQLLILSPSPLAILFSHPCVTSCFRGSLWPFRCLLFSPLAEHMSLLWPSSSGRVSQKCILGYSWVFLVAHTHLGGEQPGFIFATRFWVVDLSPSGFSRNTFAFKQGCAGGFSSAPAFVWSKSGASRCESLGGLSRAGAILGCSTPG